MVSVIVALPTLLLGLATAFLFFYLKNAYSYWKKRSVVGPEPHLLFGTLKKSTLGKIFVGSELKEVYDQFPHEKFVGIYNFAVPALLVRDLDIIRHILIKDFDLFQDRGFALDEEGLGMNLFHSDGDKWGILRKKFSPIFTSGKLKNMFHLVTDRADAFMKYVDKTIDDGKTPEIAGLTSKFTVEVIGACAFGINVNTLNDEQNQYVVMSDKVFVPSLKRLLDLMMPGIFRKLGISFFPVETVKFFNRLAKEMVKERQGKPKVRQDFMDLIVEMKEQGIVKSAKLSNGEVPDLEVTESLIAAQAFVFFVAGYETSSTTMAFALYELARNPEMQERLFEEIDRVLSANDGKIVYDSLKDYKYLSNVLSETLRIYPVVDPLNRVSLTEYKIPETDFTIPKGTPIILSASGIHNDSKYWPEPEKFDPDRFTPENSANRHPMAWQGFGDGPRHCIGMRFAKVQMTVGLVSLLRKYRVSPSARTIKTPLLSPGRLTSKMEGGIYLNIERR